MDYNPVLITDIFTEVGTATNTALRADPNSWLSLNNKNINLVYGSVNHVIQQLRSIGDNPKATATKYPMIAMLFPVKTQRGFSNDGYYGLVRPPVIYFATLSDNKRLPAAKYTDNFKPLLFPMYYEFLNQLTKHKNVVLGGDTNAISHTLGEYPADNVDTANTIFTDFLDILSVEGLEIPVKQLPITSCIKRVG